MLLVQLAVSSGESGGDIGLKIVIEAAARDLGVEQLKNEQYNAVKSFVTSNNMLVVLPTGFGKSLIYAILPAVFDKLMVT